MAIRTKQYKVKGSNILVRAVKITEKNLAELVAYICRNGGAATGHNGDTPSGKPARIRIKQHTYGKNWTKRDWRVARVGDVIVRFDGEGEGPVFARVKAGDFETGYELA